MYFFLSFFFTSIMITSENREKRDLAIKQNWSDYCDVPKNTEWKYKKGDEDCVFSLMGNTQHVASMY